MSCSEGRSGQSGPSGKMTLQNPHVKETGEMVGYILFSRWKRSLFSLRQTKVWRVKKSSAIRSTGNWSMNCKTCVLAQCKKEICTQLRSQSSSRHNYKRYKPVTSLARIERFSTWEQLIHNLQFSHDLFYHLPIIFIFGINIQYKSIRIIPILANR